VSALLFTIQREHELAMTARDGALRAAGDVVEARGVSPGPALVPRLISGLGQ